jgi:hypothetical protein
MNGIKKPGPYPYVLCLIIVLFQGSGLYSQNPSGPMGTAASTLPPVILPSPNSATLTRLISDNVDLYTGRLNVDIPIYTLKGRDLEVPVSLQGNVNAHKVNEVGGWTGLGWFLNAGGSITRVMKNLPDEFTGTISSTDYNFSGIGYTKLKQLENVDISLFEGDTYDINKKRDVINKGNWNTSNKENIEKGYDLQPDEFYFNFGKYSGKFVFDQDGNIHTISKSNLTITPSYEVRDGNNKISGYQVVTDDGYTYRFGNYSLNAVEETKLSTETRSIKYYYESVGFDGSRYVYSKIPKVATLIQPPGAAANDNFDRNIATTQLFHYPSTWYLVSITSPTADVMAFSYTDNGTITYTSDRSFSASMPNLDENWYSPLNGYFYYSAIAPVKAVSWFPNAFPSPFVCSVTYSSTSIKSKRLASIVAAGNNRIDFVANTLREDLPGDKRLDKIVVTNSKNTVLKEYKLDYEVRYSGEAVESFRFYYDMVDVLNKTYTIPTTEDRIFDIPDYMRKRMFLKSVEETGGGLNLPAYKFDYNTQALPFRSSTHQDYSGYHTRNDENHPLTGIFYYLGSKRIPVNGNLFSLNVTNGTSQLGSWGGGNKVRFFDNMIAGVLTKITYPTGGYKEFEFELNGISKNASNGLRVKTIKEYASSAAIPITKEYTYGTFYGTDEIITQHQMIENKAGNYYDDRVFWSSGRVNPENLTRGVAGGYSWVEIKQPGSGRYRVEFTNPSMPGFEDVKTPVKVVSSLLNPNVQELPVENVSPFPAATNFDWKRGLPYEEYVYDASDKLQKQTSYRYDFTTLNPQEKKIEGMAVTKVKLNYQTGSWNWHLYGKYTHYSNWYALATKTDRVFAADGDINHYVETKEEYIQIRPVLNGKEFMFPQSTKITKPGKNEELVTWTMYPWQYAISLPYDEFEEGIARLNSSNTPSKVIESYQYLQSPGGGNQRVIGGVMNKYSDYRPLLTQTYVLRPVAPISYSAFYGTSQAGGNFTYDPNYKLEASFTYSPFGTLLDQTQGQNRKEAIIWDDNNLYPIAKVTNANWSECAYTSFEEGANYGNWTLSGMYPDNAALTGKRGFSIGVGTTISKSGLNPAKTYMITFWNEHNASITVNGNQVYGEVPSKGNWRYNEVTVSGVSQVVIEGWFGVIDELRLFPKGAQMTTYMKEPLVGVTIEVDPNTRIRYYEYDGLQRLRMIKDEKGNVLKTFEYNYKDEANTAPMWAGTNVKRCVPCPQNSNYYTTEQEIRQVDVNPNSPTYKNERWYNLGVTGACVIQPDWQNIGGPTCLLNSNGYNTGIQRMVQKNMNPCSDTYNQVRNVDETNYTLCPSNGPNYQPLDEYRCQPCSANAAYVSNVQERKWKDINPSSATSGNTEWRATGAYCTNSPVWQNTVTAPRCMLGESGLPNGYQEREKRDVNPCSNTYNQTIWEFDGISSSCQRVYAFVEQNDYRDTYPQYGTTCDVWVKFYYDANRTQPANVTNAKITILEYRQGTCGDYDVETVFNNVSGQSVKLYEDVLYEFESTECSYNYWSFSLINL